MIIKSDISYNTIEKMSLFFTPDLFPDYKNVGQINIVNVAHDSDCIQAQVKLNWPRVDGVARNSHGTIV